MDATLAAFAMAMAARIRALQALVLGSEAGRIEAGRIAAEEEAASGQAPTRDPPPVEEQPSGSACKRARLAAKEERRRLKRLRRQAEREADQQQPQDQQQDQQQRHGDGPAAAGAAEAAAEAAAAAGEAEAGPAAPPELYRFWAPADVAELVLLVEDAAHRRWGQWPQWQWQQRRRRARLAPWLSRRQHCCKCQPEPDLAPAAGAWAARRWTGAPSPRASSAAYRPCARSTGTKR